MPTGTFKFGKINYRNVIKQPKSRIIYNPVYFGLSHIDGDGAGVKICIIDTGYPSHADLGKVGMTHVVDFTSSPDKAKDVHGHSTAVSAVIKANGENMIGIAPASEIFYAKALGEYGVGQHDAIQASVLYAIIKKVDIIVLSCGSESCHPVLHEVIKKAYNSNICIFAASGNISGKTKDANYPARFTEVLSVGYGKKHNTSTPSAHLNIKHLESAFLDNTYIKMSGTSILTPVVVGVAALLIQNRRKSNNPIKPIEIYKELSNLF